MLYARATKTSANNRHKFEIRSKLTDLEKQVHYEIVSLRDNAVAHYGPASGADGEKWNDERVFLPIEREEQCAASAASKRLIASPAFLDRALIHVQRVIFLTQEDMEKRQAALTDEINRVLDSDPTIFSLLKKNVVTEAEIFGGHPIGLQLGGDRTGMKKGFIWG